MIEITGLWLDEQGGKAAPMRGKLGSAGIAVEVHLSAADNAPTHNLSVEGKLVTGLWLSESKSGVKYLRGVEKAKRRVWLVFRNTHKASANHPDYVLYIDELSVNNAS